MTFCNLKFKFVSKAEESRNRQKYNLNKGKKMNMQKADGAKKN